MCREVGGGRGVLLDSGVLLLLGGLRGLLDLLCDLEGIFDRLFELAVAAVREDPWLACPLLPQRMASECAATVAQLRRAGEMRVWREE